ncbi:hypothetical protein A4G27_11140 [Mycobacterium kansasii]|nr:hypothetical protein A4G27_11140 [Mycobacterium kansasii]
MAVLKKPELPVPVLLEPEFGRPVSVVDPKPVLTLPECQKPVLLSPEFPTEGRAHLGGRASAWLIV